MKIAPPYTLCFFLTNYFSEISARWLAGQGDDVAEMYCRKHDGKTEITAPKTECQEID